MQIKEKGGGGLSVNQRKRKKTKGVFGRGENCLLYTSDAADE